MNDRRCQQKGDSSKMITLQLRKNLRPLLGDVCSADRLPAHLTDDPTLYAVNTDESWRPVKHWILFYFPSIGPVEIFNAMGNPLDHNHRRFANTVMANYGEYSYIEDRLQSGGPCWHFCIYYAPNLCRGSTAEDVLRAFDKRRFTANDSIVVNFVDRL